MPPKKKTDKLFEEVEGKIKDGGLRKSLKVKDDKPLKITELRKAAKVEAGKEFTFRGTKLKMTPRMKRQIGLAINMMK